LYEYHGLKISWLGHDSFRIKNGKTIFIDPFKIRPTSEKADILLITHEHYDHLSMDDIKKVVNENTTIVTIPAVKKELSSLKVKEVRAVKPGDKLKLGDVSIDVIRVKDVRIYHAGDTDAIPEMRGLKPDVALLPVSGTYVMTPDEAAQAVKMVEPKLAIPMHYGVIVGTEQDAQKFKQLSTVEVQILKPE
jgi:L-ascorbate metabolism protein UlaG (beta-lactamase superfamily)